MTGVEMNNAVVRALGMADAFALVSAAFAFPDESLVEGLLNATFVADLKSIAADAGLPLDESNELCASIEALTRREDADALLTEMRIEYSALYYAPGKFRKIYPYESVFKKRVVAPHARATAFLTKSTHDVEREMGRRGVLPANARREPADCFVTELDFMRHLFTGYSAALIDGDDPGSWLEDARRFYGNHVADWIPDLFEKTAQLSDLAIYRAFAQFGLLLARSAASYLGQEV